MNEDRIKAVAERLAALPRKSENLSTKSGTVRKLRGLIIAAQKKGYSYTDIASILAEEGISIDSGTLKSYMARDYHSSAKAKPSRTHDTKEAVKNNLRQPSKRSIICTRNLPDHAGFRCWMIQTTSEAAGKQIAEQNGSFSFFHLHFVEAKRRHAQQHSGYSVQDPFANNPDTG